MQRHINYNNVHENAKRVNHTYLVGGYAYVLWDGIYHKLEGDKLGLYCVTEVFTQISLFESKKELWTKALTYIA